MAATSPGENKWGIRSTCANSPSSRWSRWEVFASWTLFIMGDAVFSWPLSEKCQRKPWTWARLRSYCAAKGLHESTCNIHCLFGSSNTLKQALAKRVVLLAQWVCWSVMGSEGSSWMLCSSAQSPSSLSPQIFWSQRSLTSEMQKSLKISDDGKLNRYVEVSQSQQRSFT